jgi:lantibiotic modifying enzyme
MRLARGRAADMNAAVPSWVAVARAMIHYLSRICDDSRAERSLSGGPTDLLVGFAAAHRCGSECLAGRLSVLARKQWEAGLGERLNWSMQPLFASSITPILTGSCDKQDMGRFTIRLLMNHPSLLRLVCRQIENWWDFAAMFLRHLQQFTFGSIKKTVMEIHPNLSDPHEGSRCVVGVRFSDHDQWYYKPRSGRLEVGWFRLLAWANSHKFSRPFKIIRLLSAEDHCWMQQVDAMGISSSEEAVSFYHRSGAILYLAHILRAVDLHAGNLIAHGDQPVLIDCETLLHSRTLLPKPIRQQAPGILRTGLLPLRTSTRFSDVSALGRSAPGKHLLLLRGHPVEPGKFVASLEAGFLEMHQLLHRFSIAPAAISRLMRNDETPSVRCIYRPTSMYAEIFHRSVAPHILRNGWARSVFLGHACGDGRVPNYCVTGEMEALEDGDIPIFRRTAGPARPSMSEAAFRKSVSVLRSAFIHS